MKHGFARPTTTVEGGRAEDQRRHALLNKALAPASKIYLQARVIHAPMREV
jgi:hypothetical protein